jgi:hypothetical protein
MGPDGRMMVVPDDFNANDYGVSDYDPNAPFGSNASVPPSPAMSSQVTPAETGEVLLSSKWGPGPTPGGPPPPQGPEVPVSVEPNMSTADQVVPNPAMPSRAESNPVQLTSVDVRGSASGDGYVPGTDPEQNPIAFMQRGQRPVTPEQFRIADQYGYKWVGGQAERQQIDPFWQNAARSGQYDPETQKDILANASIDQQLANQGNTDAALEQNRAAIEGVRREQAFIERMQLEQARKNAATREQVAADRSEWERQKNAYEKDVRDGDSILGTPQGALSTIFGMLAIGLAARGSRENLDSTINAVNSNIDRQVNALRAQTKAKGEMADNAYSRYLRSYGNEEQAQAATKALMLDRAAKQVELTSLRSRDPAIQAGGQQAAADIRSRLAEQMAIIEQESQGKVSQAWNPGQTARAGTRGGYQALNAAEQRARDTAEQKVTGEALGNQKTATEIQKNLTEAQGGATSGDLKDFAPQLKERRAANEALSKALKAIDAIKATGEGENFGGLDDTSLTPATAAATGAIERKLSSKAARQMNEIDGIIDAKTLEAFGSSTPEQRQTVADRILGDGSKQGLLANLEREAEASRQKIREIDASIPASVQGAGDARRVQTGAATRTVAQPGRAIPGG